MVKQNFEISFVGEFFDDPPIKASFHLNLREALIA